MLLGESSVLFWIKARQYTITHFCTDWGSDLSRSRAASRISFLSRVAYLELPMMPRLGLATRYGRKLCHFVASSCSTQQAKDSASAQVLRQTSPLLPSIAGNSASKNAQHNPEVTVNSGRHSFPGTILCPLWPATLRAVQRCLDKVCLKSGALCR